MRQKQQADGTAIAAEVWLVLSAECGLGKQCTQTQFTLQKLTQECVMDPGEMAQWIGRFAMHA